LPFYFIDTLLILLILFLLIDDAAGLYAPLLRVTPADAMTRRSMLPLRYAYLITLALPQMYSLSPLILITPNIFAMRFHTLCFADVFTPRYYLLIFSRPPREATPMSPPLRLRHFRWHGTHSTRQI